MCSFGNPAIGKEHWLQIYPHLSHFDHLAIRLKITMMASSPILIKDSLHGSTDPPISMTKQHFGAILY